MISLSLPPPGRALTRLLAVALLAGCAHTPSEAPPAPLVVKPAAKPEPHYRPFPEESFYDLLVAEFAIRRQRYDIALERYRNQAQTTADLGVIATTARLAQFINDDDIALQATDWWLARAPGAPEAHFIRASSLAKTRRPLDGLEHMRRVLESGHETNFAALAASALSLSEQEQQAFEQAITAMLAEYPQNLNLKTGVALTLQYRGKEQESLRLIREVLAAEPTDVHALLIETRVLQQLDRNDEATERLRFAVDHYPFHKRLRLNLAQLLTRSDLYQAKAQYTVLANQFPEDSNIALGLALVNQEIGDYSEAQRLLKLLVDDARHAAHARYFLGRIAERQQRWSDATEHYQAVGPGDQQLPALTRLVEIEHEQAGLESARARLDEARAKHPEWEVQLFLIESDLLFERRLYNDGHRLLTQALDKYPGNTNLLYARSLFSERQKNVALMEQDLRTILAEDPENATALNALGYSLAILTDRLEEARGLVRKALDLRPDDPAIQDSYGWIAYRLGDLPLAEEYLQRAFKQSQDHEIAAHLGEVLWRLGQRQQAIAVWQKGLRDNPQSTIIMETLDRLEVALPEANGSP